MRTLSTEGRTILTWLLNKLALAVSWILALLGLAAILAWGGWWYYQSRIDGELRAAVESKLAKEFPELQITLGQARLIEGKGLEFRHVAIAERQASGPHPELVQIEELAIDCDTNLTRLSAGDVAPRQIVARHITVTATHRPQDTWSVAALRALTKAKSCCRPCPIVIEGGTLLLYDPLKDPSGTYALREIRAELIPEPIAEAAPSSPAIATYAFRGTASGDYLRRVQLEGTLQGDGQTCSCNCSGSAEGLQLSPDLAKALPEAISAPLAALGELRGEISADFRFRSSGDAVPDFQLQAKIEQGSWVGAQWPEGLNGLTAKFACDREGLRVDELTATSGVTSIWLRGARTGWSESASSNWDLHLRGVQVDRSLREKLPSAYHFLWDDYQPEGSVDITLRLISSGDSWQPDLVVDCSDLSFAYRAFPYRISKTRGRITYRGNNISAKLQGFAGAHPLRIEGEIAQPRDNWTGWVDIRSEHPMPIEPRLIAALPEATQRVAHSLSPRGLMHFAGRFERKSPGQPLAMQLGIDISQGELVYQHFPYPLSNIRGRIECSGETWRFIGFSGNHGSTQVTASGQWAKQGGIGQLTLQMLGRQVELNAALRDALPLASRAAWQSLRPQGSIDEVNVSLGYGSGDLQPDVLIRARQFPPQQTGRQLAIDPVSCSYRLDGIHGEAELQKGTLVLRGLRAMHGRTTFAGDAAVAPIADGRTRIDLSAISVDRLLLDDQLAAVLPVRWRGVVSQLNLSGACNLRGNAQVVGDFADPASLGRRPAPLAANWDVAIDVDDAGLNVGVPLEHLHGAIRLTGSSQGESWSSRGELAIDSLICKGIQVTQIQGPVWLDPTVVALGAPAHRGDPRKLPRQIVAKALGGTLYGDAQASPTADGPFSLQAALTDASLTQAALELAPAHRELKGRLFAALELSGAGRRPEALRGKGNIRLRDADLYELPVFFSIFKLARGRQPDRTAFTNADGEFEIAAGRAIFRQISLAGDAVTLKGQGEVGFDRQVNLTMHSIVGNEGTRIPILTPVIGEASRQIMEIRVTGTLDHPNLDSKAFPALKETLDRIFPDLRERGAERMLWPRR